MLIYLANRTDYACRTKGGKAVLAALFGLLLAWPAGPLLADDSRAARQQTAQNAQTQGVYDHLMNTILGQPVEAGTGSGQQYQGATNPYRQLRAKKALAACIFWRPGSIAELRHGGWSAHWAPEDESLAAILEVTVRNCRQYEEKGCGCQIIDIGGQNTVEVPAEVAASLQ